MGRRAIRKADHAVRQAVCPQAVRFPAQWNCLPFLLRSRRQRPRYCACNLSIKRSDFMSEPQTHVVPAAVADLPEGNYVYILQCNDQTLYTGWTTSLQHRLETHNSGSGAKYTRSRRPVTLVYYEELSGKSDALKREAAIKHLTKSQKEALIASERNQLCMPD